MPLVRIIKAISFAGSSSNAADHAPVVENMSLVLERRIWVMKNESIAPASNTRMTVQNGTFRLIFNSKKRTKVDMGIAKEPLNIIPGIRLGFSLWLNRNIKP